MKRPRCSLERPKLPLLLAIALLLALIGGSSAAAQVADAPCPLICSTPEIYGFIKGSTGLCQCAAALPGGGYFLRHADDCLCSMCFAPQPDGTVLGYFYKDGSTCIEGSVDCDRIGWRLQARALDHRAPPAPEVQAVPCSNLDAVLHFPPENSTATTSQPTAAPAGSSTTSSPPPASASSSSISSTSKSGGWSGIATGVLTFLCVLVLGLAIVTVTTVHCKNARTRLNRYGGGGDDIFFRAQGSNNGGSVSFEAPTATVVTPAIIAVRSHVIGEAPAATYEVLVFGVDSSNEYEQHHEQQRQLTERQL